MSLQTNAKKLASGVVALATVFSFVGAAIVTPALASTVTTTSTTTSTTTVAPYTFSNNLTIGSTGADVVALQSFLVAKGFLTIPTGVSMGYFGTLTQSALGAYQASVGISPTAGYFGPITRANVNAAILAMGSTSTVPGCTAGAMFSSTTGASCTTGTTTTTSTVAGCTSTAGYSPTTGASCSGTTSTVGTVNGSGVLTVTQETPGSNSNIQQNVNVPVYGLQLQAQLGDVRVDRINLDVSDVIQSTQTQIENPGNFINNVTVTDGTTVYYSQPVNSTNFVTGTSSTDYYLQLAGLNFTVPNGTTKNLMVEFSTSGSIDTNRILTIKGFGGTSLLYYSGVNNTPNYVDISGISTTQQFQKPGNSTVIIGVDQSNPLSLTNYVDINNGSQDVPLLVFNTNTTQGNSQVTQVTATVNSTGTAPTGIHLFQGSTELGYQSVSGASSTVTFANLFTTNTSGGNVYSIKADFPSNTVNGTVASTTVSSVVYKNSNGNSQTASGSVSGNNQYFYHATPQLTFVSAGTIKNQSTSGTTASIDVNFNFTVTPYPGTAAAPTLDAKDFTIVARSSTGTSSPLTSKALVITPSPSNGTLAANQTYNIALSANDSSTGAGQTVTYYITSASSTVKDANGNNVNIVQTWGLDNFHTNPVSKN